MSRQRFIYPDIWQSDGFCSLSRDARLLFIGLFSTADDYGRGRGSATVLRAAIFTNDTDIDHEDVERWSAEIATKDMALFYRVGSSVFYQIPTWNKHQNPRHRSADRYPHVDRAEAFLYVDRQASLPADGRTYVTAGAPPADLRRDAGVSAAEEKRREEKRREGERGGERAGTRDAEPTHVVSPPVAEQERREILDLIEHTRRKRK